MRTPCVIATLALALTISGCGSGSGAGNVDSDGGQSSEEMGRILESGFGQAPSSPEYVQGVALVQNLTKDAGHTVTVNMNFLDAKGKTVVSQSQVDAFSYPGQTIAVTVFADLGGAKTKIASIEPTLLVEDLDVFEEAEVDYGKAKGRVASNGFGGLVAKVPVKNPTSEPLSGPDLGVVCRNRSGTIIGGANTFPELVPAKGQILASVDLIVTGKPATCTGYISPPAI